VPQQRSTEDQESGSLMSERKRLTRLQAEAVLANKLNLFSRSEFFTSRDAAVELLTQLKMKDRQTAEAFEREFEALKTADFEGYSWMAHCLSATPEQIALAVCAAFGIEVEQPVPSLPPKSG
jgi:hypothetical protein